VRTRYILPFVRLLTLRMIDLNALEARMIEQGWPAEEFRNLFVVGGATMVFDLKTRKTTHDIDFIWPGPTDDPKLNKLKEEITWVAKKLNIREDWMNDKVTNLVVKGSERNRLFGEALEVLPIMESKPKIPIRLPPLSWDCQFAMKFDAVARSKLTQEQGGGMRLKKLDLTDAVALLHKMNKQYGDVSSVKDITRLAETFHRDVARYKPEAAVEATWEYINTEYKSKYRVDGIVEQKGSQTPENTSDTSVD